MLVSSKSAWGGLALVAAVGGVLFAYWRWSPSRDLPPPDPVALSTRTAEAVLPLPPVPDLPPEKVALGKALFLDPRLSHDNTIACASCHDLLTAGHDKRRYSVGVGGAVGGVNAPSVFNAALSFVQFWDGRAASLEEQAAGPVHNPLEMASDWKEVLAKLNADNALVSRFELVYRQRPTAENVVDAIATFERTLLTVNSPFDRYLRGDEQAIDADAKAGFRLFKAVGCASCHQGANFGGNMFQRFGVMLDYAQGRPDGKPPTEADLGRFNVTHREEDRFVFKVPGLRNVALTAPYFHDGSVTRLEDAVAVMGKSQLGRELSADEIRRLVAFLRTLTGERPATAAP